MSNAATSFASILASHPNEPAYVCLGYSATRGEVLDASDHMAGYLVSLGIQRGDAFAVWLPMGGVWLQLLFAAARLGALVIPLSTRLRHDEALHVIRTSGAKAIFVQPEFVAYDYGAAARQIQAEVTSLERIIEVQESAGLMDLRAYAPVATDQGHLDDLLCTFSTSGTTGHPKLAAHTQGGILRHVWEVVRYADVQPGDKTLCVMSMDGVFGFMQALSLMAGRGQCVFMPVFNLTAAAQLIDQMAITHFYGGEGLFDEVMEVPGSNVASLKVVGFAEFNGRGLAVTRKARERYGIRMTALYGSSECFSIQASQSREDDDQARAVPGGKPISADILFRVVDIETGKVLPDGERGELQFRGYNVMDRYLNNPQDTARAFTPDGWFRSGDLGYRYESGERFCYVSRIKDTLRLRGYLVDPIEIESFLMRQPGVRDAQVVGWRHPEKGDIAVAFVRKRAEDVTERQLYEYCRAGLANYKVPSHFVFVQDYPSRQGANGNKVLKNKLREMAQKIVMSQEQMQA